MGIYVISNTRNGVVYVGSAVDIEQRWAQHRSELDRGRHSNRQFQRDWTFYGAQAFNFTIVETVDRVEDLTPAEQYWIDHYIDTLGLHFLYNLQLSVPQRASATTVQAQPVSQTGSGCAGCLAAPFLFVINLPWRYIVPCAAVGLLAMLIASTPGGIYFAITGDNPPRYIGDTNMISLFNFLTFSAVAIWFYIWYWRLHPPAKSGSGQTVTCPDCSTTMPDSARFCPGCGKPRTSVQEELEQEAARTGVDYDWLLEEQRAREPEPARPQSFIERWRMLLASRSLRVSLVVFGIWVVAFYLFLLIAASENPTVS